MAAIATKKITRDKVRALADEVGRVAVQLMDAPPCTAATDRASCIIAEERRPLTTVERKQGLGRRPFDRYDDTRLCNACSAYWHASVAAIRLVEIARRTE